ncbi:energy transducer TonB family protein [Stenotrophomonas sp. Ker107b]
MKAAWQWVLALGVAAASVGVAPQDVRASPSMRALQGQVESSMRIKGSLDIGTDGRVVAVRLDRESAIPAGVVTFVKDAVARWEFEPTVRDGQSVAITTPMTLRLIGKTLDDGGSRVEIRHASFVEYDQNDPTIVARERGSVPTFPVRRVGREAAADVFLLIQVGRDGKVRNALAEQVNLRVLVPPREVASTRAAFADSATQAVRDWQFRVPTQGPRAARDTWVVRFPVRFAPPADRNAPRWEPYLPGPRNTAPWLAPETQSVAPDALDDGVYLAGEQTGPQLKTVLDQG